jgi:hypothetical protein
MQALESKKVVSSLSDRYRLQGVYTHHIDNAVFSGCSCDIQFTVWVTKFTESSGRLLTPTGEVEARVVAFIKKQSIDTYDIHRHGRFLAKNCGGPIDVRDIAKYSGTEPHPESIQLVSLSFRDTCGIYLWNAARFSRIVISSSPPEE